MRKIYIIASIIAILLIVTSFAYFFFFDFGINAHPQSEVRVHANQTSDGFMLTVDNVARGNAPLPITDIEYHYNGVKIGVVRANDGPSSFSIDDGSVMIAYIDQDGDGNVSVNDHIYLNYSSPIKSGIDNSVFLIDARYEKMMGGATYYRPNDL